MLNPHVLRVDNCESHDVRQRLTAAYMPYKVGHKLTYDVALFSPTDNKEPVVMQVKN